MLLLFVGGCEGGFDGRSCAGHGGGCVCMCSHCLSIITSCLP